MNCEFCGDPIKVREDYVYVRRHIPNGVAFTPEDAADRGIHIHCFTPAAAE